MRPPKAKSSSSSLPRRPGTLDGPPQDGRCQRRAPVTLKGEDELSLTCHRPHQQPQPRPGRKRQSQGWAAPGDGPTPAAAAVTVAQNPCICPATAWGRSRTGNKIRTNYIREAVPVEFYFLFFFSPSSSAPCFGPHSGRTRSSGRKKCLAETIPTNSTSENSNPGHLSRLSTQKSSCV